MTKKKYRWIVGIDEAGRGPLAGPVAVGAFTYDISNPLIVRALREIFPVVKDSKQLSKAKREYLYARLTGLKQQGLVNFSVSLVSAKVIDKRGITFAISQGISQTLTRLSLDPKKSKILLDGGLRAPKDFINQKTYIRGDATHLPIALASIVAKVTRDRYMVRMGKHHLHYGFESHKGYGTNTHYRVIKKRGLTTIHRKTFIHQGT